MSAPIPIGDWRKDDPGKPLKECSSGTDAPIGAACDRARIHVEEANQSDDHSRESPQKLTEVARNLVRWQGFFKNTAQAQTY
jgi:hypothetical protein